MTVTGPPSGSGIGYGTASGSGSWSGSGTGSGSGSGSGAWSASGSGSGSGSGTGGYSDSGSGSGSGSGSATGSGSGSGGPVANTAPYVFDAWVTTTAGVPVGLYTMAWDPDGDPVVVTPGQPAHGTLVQNGFGSFTYTPVAGFTGTDEFLVTASDGRGGVATAGAHVTIGAGPPVGSGYGSGAGSGSGSGSGLVVGRVWADANGNGRPEADEPGVYAAVIEVATDSDFINRTVATTAADGTYTLTSAQAGYPYRRVTLPSGLVFLFTNGVVTTILAPVSTAAPVDGITTNTTTPVPPPTSAMPGTSDTQNGTDDGDDSDDWDDCDFSDEMDDSDEPDDEETQFINFTPDAPPPPAADPLPATLTGPPLNGFEFEPEAHPVFVAQLNAWWQNLGADRKATLTAWWQKATPAERTALLDGLNALASDTMRDEFLKTQTGTPLPALPTPEPAPTVTPPTPPRTGTIADLQQWQADAAREQAARDARGDRLLQDLRDDRDARDRAAFAIEQEVGALANARRRSPYNFWVHFGTGDYVPLDTNGHEAELREKAAKIRNTIDFALVDGEPVAITDAGRAREAAWKDAKTWATMPALDKLGAALNAAIDKGLITGEIANQLRELAKPENLALVGGFGAVGVGAALWGGGPAAFAAAIGYLIIGKTVVEVSNELYMGISGAMGARSQADIDAAAARLATGIGKLTVEGGTAVAGMGAMKLAGGVGMALKGKKLKQGENGKVEVVPEGTPAAGAEWVRPPGLKLPKNGTWEGTPGNSNFKPTNSAELGLKPGDVVPFRQGRPDFSPWSKGNFTSKEPLTGVWQADREKMYRALAQEKGWSIQKVKDWLTAEKYSPHHSGGDNFQLIPWALHGNPNAVPPIQGVRHTGGAFDLRNP